MKSKIFSGIDEEHLVRSALYLGAALAAIILSFPFGILKGNGMGVLFFGLGLSVFLFALMHPWGNAKYYFIQYAVLFLLYALIWIFRTNILSLFELKGHWQEDIAFSVGGICVISFIITLIGIYVFSYGLKCLLYSAATIALMTIFIMFPNCIPPDPSVKLSVVIPECIILVLLFIIVYLFFKLAMNKQRGSRYPKIALLITGIMLILMAAWGFLNIWELHWAAGMRAWAMLLCIAGIMSIYGFVILEKSLEVNEQE